MLNSLLDVIAGHIAYLSMLMVEVYHTHPVLRTFVQLLEEIKTRQPEPDTAGLFFLFLHE